MLMEPLPYRTSLHLPSCNTGQNFSEIYAELDEKPSRLRPTDETKTDKPETWLRSRINRVEYSPDLKIIQFVIRSDWLSFL